MRKVLFLLALLLPLSLVSTTAHATPTINHCGLTAEHVQFKASDYALPVTSPFYNGNPYEFMRATAHVSGDPTHPVYLDSPTYLDPKTSGAWELDYWADFYGPDQGVSVGTLMDQYTDQYGDGIFAPPGSAWEDRTYLFSVDGATRNLYVPSGSFENRELAIPQVSVSGTVNPLISWDPVEGADQYRVYIHALDNVDYPIMNAPVFRSDPLCSLSFTYVGDLFKGGDEYSMLVVAEQLSPYWGGPMNRSGFFLKHSAPVPEPTTILLVGSGLIGFARFRDRMKRRHS